MPIYEYRCDACGHQEEHLQKVTDGPLTACPSCGKASYRKLLSAAGFQLKGSGWYATDFKSSAKKADKPAEGKAEAKPESKGDAKGGDAKGGESKGGESKSEPTPKAAA